MIKLIRIFLGLCTHQWELIKSTRMYDCSFDEKGFYYETRRQCVCRKCGKWKTFRIK